MGDPFRAFIFRFLLTATAFELPLAAANFNNDFCRPRDSWFQVRKSGRNGGHLFHQGQPSSETKMASTKYVYVPPLLASSISYRPDSAGTLIQNVLD